MSCRSELRKCDMLGAPITLKSGGISSYASTGGGLASIVIKIFILAFFCMQLVAVLGYNDPQITSFTVLDSRESMTSPVTLGENRFEFYFYFTDLLARPVILDKRIGSLKLY